MTWQKVSDVTNQPIDFHAMMMGNNPETIYGSSGMGNIIYVTQNEGKTWTGVSPTQQGKDNNVRSKPDRLYDSLHTFA